MKTTPAATEARALRQRLNSTHDSKGRLVVRNLFAGVALLVLSCSTTKWKDSQEYLASLEIGDYDNLYEGDRELAGLQVYQLPLVDNAMEDYSVYIGKHPGTIDYHFWDGRLCSVRYSPEGKILAREWARHTPELDAAGYTSWGGVDFSKGSDPEFKHHKDPRKK